MSSERLLLKRKKIATRTRIVPAILIILVAFASTTDCVWAQSSSRKEFTSASITTASGRIDSEVFSQSVSTTMTVGKTYTVLLLVTNTGTVEAVFVAELVVPFRYSFKYFFCRNWTQTINLFPGESQSVEFLITPLLENVGPLELRGSLYKYSLDSANLVDSVAASVFETRLTFQPWSIAVLIAVVLFIVIGIAFLVFRKLVNKKTILIVLILFSFAFLLRAPDLLNVAIYPDEYTLWIASVQILHNNWQWPTDLMYSYPPLWMYLEAILVFLFGSHLDVLRAISVISGALSVVMLYFLGKSLFGRKVGLLSAGLLGFSNLHILYSRVAMTDSLTLLFALTASYFFWKGYERNGWKYMCMSGVFFGLGFNVKYIVVAQVLACIFFVVWVERSWKRLRVRALSLLTLMITFFIVVSPVQFLLLRNNVNPYQQYTSQLFYAGPASKNLEVIRHSIGDSLFRGLELGVHIFTMGGSPWLPWLTVFEISVVVLLLVGILYHVYPSLRGQPKESFVLISSVVSLFPIAFYALRHYYWLLYFLPWYLVMLSNLSIHCAHCLHRSLAPNHISRPPLDGIRLLLLVLVVVFVSSHIVVGTATPLVDTGEFSGFRSAMLYVKNRVQPGEVISEPWIVGTLYYINSLDINVTFVPLLKINAEPSWIQRPKGVVTFSADEQVFRVWKPRFIITSRAHFDLYFDATMKSEILENYSIVFTGTPSVGYILKGDKATDIHIWMVFERVGI